MKEYIGETRSLKKYYQMGEKTVKALDGVDFRVKDQEFVAIIGKSGSGKSTLLHMLGGLDVPTEGEVLVEGKYLRHLIFLPLIEISSGYIAPCLFHRHPRSQ